MMIENVPFETIKTKTEHVKSQIVEIERNKAFFELNERFIKRKLS